MYGEEDSLHRHPAISVIYILHQDVFLKYEAANYSLFNIVSKSKSKILHGNRASWEFLKACVAFSLLFVEIQANF